MSDFLCKCFERESSDRPSVEELWRDEWLKDVDINPFTSETEFSPSNTAIRSGNNN